MQTKLVMLVKSAGSDKIMQILAVPRELYIFSTDTCQYRNEVIILFIITLHPLSNRYARIILSRNGIT